MTSTMLLLPLFVGVLMVIFSFLVRRYTRMKGEIDQLASVFPYPKSLETFLFGAWLPLAQNVARLPHYRMDMFNIVETQEGKKFDTIQELTHCMDDYFVILLTRDPPLIKHILTDNFDVWVKTGFFRSITSSFIGGSLVWLNHGPDYPGEHLAWHFQRKVAAHIFSKNAFKGHVTDSFKQNMDILFDGIEVASKMNSGVFDIKRYIYAFTLDSIGKIALDMDIKSLDALKIEGKQPSFAQIFDDINSSMLLRLTTPAWHIFGRLFGSERRLYNGLRKLDQVLYDVISNRKTENFEGKGDILSLFLIAKEEEKGEVDDRLLRDMACTFLFAGRDTTAGTLTFAFYLLATHPEVQKKLFVEIQKLLGSDKVTMDGLKPLKYLDGFVLEILRLFPVTSFNGRESSRDDILPNGVRVKKGTVIQFENFVLGRDELIFPNAGALKPERWWEGKYSDRIVQSFDPYTIPTFTAGKRMCLGKDLAFYEIKYFIVEFMRKFSISVPKGSPLEHVDMNDVAIIGGRPVYGISLTLTFNGDLKLLANPRS